mmetsp:Transcript_213/g.834  ORF Transcript_213/g.834 Transcript_213/m.834 type:complete len:205 (+) Transcript_213:493-1107(+)
MDMWRETRLVTHRRPREVHFAQIGEELLVFRLQHVLPQLLLRGLGQGHHRRARPGQHVRRLLERVEVTRLDAVPFQRLQGVPRVRPKVHREAPGVSAPPPRQQVEQAPRRDVPLEGNALVLEPNLVLARRQHAPKVLQGLLGDLREVSQPRRQHEEGLRGRYRRDLVRVKLKLEGDRTPPVLALYIGRHGRRRLHRGRRSVLHF